ncbi:MAG: TIGR02269 family lipoprotein [Flavobacteriaceae bacterium]|nr:TIGR02269 family lipoprotein [Flavobacteriaceae bacterium]
MFNFSIGYNSGTNPLYNGNISETKWRTANSDSSLKSYAYSYDPLNRISSAIGGSTSNYDLSSIAYDKNGNITSIVRRGHTNSGATSFGVMDNLVYTYDSGNKLLKIVDNGNNTYGFRDGTNTGNDFSFDANGNQTQDLNKDVTSVEYNHLNMPTKITVTGANAGVLDYKYSANGTKLRKIKTQGGVTTTTDYAKGFVYENNVLKQFGHPEGYVEPDGSGYQYVYRLTDIWGNTRITFADDNNNGSVNSSEIRKERNFYPFGLEHRGYNSSSYGVENNLKTYQKQELNKDFELNVHEWKHRFGDPASVRFWQVDPLAEDYVYNGVYNFSENDPVSGVELEGLEKLNIHVYNVIKDHKGNYTATFQMQTTTTGHNWSGTKSQKQIQILDSYDQKTVTNLYTGDNATANAAKDGINISEWKGRDVSASDIWEGAKNNPEFQRAGETLKNVATVASLIVGPELLVERAIAEVAVGVRATGALKALPSAGKTVKHHIFNVFRGNSSKSQKYRDFFKKHNIDLDANTVHIPEGVHKKLHAAGNNWTTKWKKWIDDNPNATTKEVYQQAGKMMDEYGISGYAIKPYK